MPADARSASHAPSTAPLSMIGGSVKIRTMAALSLLMAVATPLASVAATAAETRGKPTVVDSLTRGILTPASAPRLLRTACFTTVLPAATVMESKQCNVTIGQVGSGGSKPQVFVRIGALFSTPGTANARQAVGSAFAADTKPGSATSLQPPTFVKGRYVGFTAASFIDTRSGSATCTKLPNGVNDCNVVPSSRSLILYYADAPKNRYELQGRALSIFAITCNMLPGATLKSQTAACHAIAKAFKFA